MKLNFDIAEESDNLHITHPERKMWLAVIIQAFADIIDGTKDETLNARLWFQHPIYSEDRKRVCELAGLDVRHAQRLANKLVEDYCDDNTKTH